MTYFDFPYKKHFPTPKHGGTYANILPILYGNDLIKALIHPFTMQMEGADKTEIVRNKRTSFQGTLLCAFLPVRAYGWKRGCR